MQKAERFTFEAQEFRNPKRTLKLSCYRWGKGEKLILIVHGWEAKALDFYKMIPALVHEGYTVVAFDGPGHGLSEGERTSLVDFKEILPRLIAQVGTPHAIIAHSMGAAASAYMLMENAIHVPRFAALAMPFDSKYFFDWAFDFMHVPHRMRYAFFDWLNHQVGEPISRYNLLQRPEKVKADKMLLVYEVQDEEVPVAHVKQYLEKHPEVEPYEVNGVGHNRVMKDKAIIEKIVSFLK